MYTVQYMSYIVHCTVYYVHCTVQWYILQWSEVQYTVEHSEVEPDNNSGCPDREAMQSALCTIQCTVYIFQCSTVYTVECTVDS